MLIQNCSLGIRVLTLHNFCWYSFAIILECWKEEPNERPDFSQLTATISATLEALAGYMDFSLPIKEECLVAAKEEVKTRAGGSNVQLPSEEGASQQEAAV